MSRISRKANKFNGGHTARRKTVANRDAELNARNLARAATRYTRRDADRYTAELQAREEERPAIASTYPSGGVEPRRVQPARRASRAGQRRSDNRPSVFGDRPDPRRAPENADLYDRRNNPGRRTPASDEFRSQSLSEMWSSLRDPNRMDAYHKARADHDNDPNWVNYAYGHNPSVKRVSKAQRRISCF